MLGFGRRDENGPAAARWWHLGQTMNSWTRRNDPEVLGASPVVADHEDPAVTAAVADVDGVDPKAKYFPAFALGCMVCYILIVCFVIIIMLLVWFFQ